MVQIILALTVQSIDDYRQWSLDHVQALDVTPIKAGGVAGGVDVGVAGKMGVAGGVDVNNVILVVVTRGVDGDVDVETVSLHEIVAVPSLSTSRSSHSSTPSRADS